MLGSQRVRDCVLRCGALEYNNGIVSDHRGLYVDLDSSRLFGGSVHDPVAAASRGFSSKNEKKVRDYLDYLEKYIQDHKVEERVDSLIMEAPNLTRKEIKQRFEAIDWDLTWGMLSSKKKVKSKQFKYAWSVALDQAGYRVRYWRTRLSDVSNHSTSHKALGQLFERSGLSDTNDDVNWDIEKVKEELKKARADLKAIQ